MVATSYNQMQIKLWTDVLLHTWHRSHRILQAPQDQGVAVAPRYECLQLLAPQCSSWGAMMMMMMAMVMVTVAYCSWSCCSWSCCSWSCCFCFCCSCWTASVPIVERERETASSFRFLHLAPWNEVQRRDSLLVLSLRWMDGGGVWICVPLKTTSNKQVFKTIKKAKDPAFGY